MLPELTPNAQALVSQRLEIQAPTGLLLYAQLLQLNGQPFNATSNAYEASNPTNWSTYVVPITEVIPGTGVYFGEPPIGTGVGQGTRLLPIYQTLGSVPASTDQLYLPTDASLPLVFVLELNPNSAIVSLIPFRPANSPYSTGGAISLPARQDSLAIHQDLLNKLYSARLQLATQPYATVMVDGQSVTFTDPAKLDDQIQHWERKVAIVRGTRRRVNSLRLDRF